MSSKNSSNSNSVLSNLKRKLSSLKNIFEKKSEEKDKLIPRETPCLFTPDAMSTGTLENSVSSSQDPDIKCTISLPRRRTQKTTLDIPWEQPCSSCCKLCKTKCCYVCCPYVVYYDT